MIILHKRVPRTGGGGGCVHSVAVVDLVDGCEDEIMDCQCGEDVVAGGISSELCEKG